jgi:hypothetical protein
LRWFLAPDLDDLATLKFLDAREDILAIGPPGTGKSHVAKALASTAVQRGYKVLYREAHQLVEDLTEARELGTLRKVRAQYAAAELLLIDDLFLRRLPAHAGDELADVLMSRYETASTIITSNRPLEDWTQLLGDVVVEGRRRTTEAFEAITFEPELTQIKTFQTFEPALSLHTSGLVSRAGARDQPEPQLGGSAHRLLELGTVLGAWWCRPLFQPNRARQGSSPYSLKKTQDHKRSS